MTQPKQDTAVRITSYLKSEKFGDYVTMYPDNADLKKLAGTYVSVTVNVLGTDLHCRPGGRRSRCRPH